MNDQSVMPVKDPDIIRNIIMRLLSDYARLTSDDVCLSRTSGLSREQRSIGSLQETQLSLRNRATRLEVSQGHQTCYRSI